ncbi:hypothetical protein SAPIO_CDS8849 [Scedosporium apiospermum]|uniref:NWD NACHT-NTPase N-terminal domain-containing protein n=1 Tax=Pseudallescheria apiosperma TaxID=563466 RepID=A0A084FXT3_PSEDA|nr:uncharacterized protein SAPIO_CDS8849 [Scedosporium apiospermum]KEZ39895.1 hypothetical protein SAPIO_CDS8849 [Scedosporium apiospermum]
MERADPIEFQSNKPSAPPGQASGVVQEPTGSQIPLSSIIGDGSQGQTAISNPDSETNRASTLQTRLTRPDLSISRDLWDVAYDALQESHPLLLNEYEKILSSRLRGPEDDARGEQPINLIDRTDNDRRRQQMIDVIRLGIQKLEETLKTALETNHGKFIARMKDDIRSAIQDTPELKQELPRRGWTEWTRNPDQRRGASQMLDLCSTMNFFCDLPKVLLQNGLAEYNDRFSQALRTDIRELILNQYRAILLFQIQLLYSCYRTSGFQLADLGNISADWGPVALARESLTHGQRDLLPHSVGLAAVGVCGICDKIRELLLLAILTLGVRTAHLHLSQGGGNDDDTKATDSTFIDALSEFVEQFISSHPPAMDKTLFEIHWSFSSSRRLRPPTSVITTTCLRVAANIIGLESLLRQIQQHYASTEISAEIAEITETLLQSLLPQGKQAVREYFRIYIRERTSMAYTLDPVIKDTSVTTEVNSPCRGGPAALSADATQPDAAKHNVIGLVIAVDGDGMTAADGRDFINIFGPGDWNQRLEAVDNRRVVNHPNVPASDQFSLPHPIVARVDS